MAFANSFTSLEAMKATIWIRYDLMIGKAVMCSAAVIPDRLYATWGL